MKILIKNGTVIMNGSKSVINGAVLIEDNSIKEVYESCPDIICDEVVDAKGQYIIPGFIETHTHGILGHDFDKATTTDIEEIEKAHLQEGVTSFLASITCGSHEEILQLLDMYNTCPTKNLVGVHIEGPFLNIEYKGVMKEEHIQAPSLDKFKEYQKHCKTITSMTIAPEIEGAKEIIEYGNKQGIVMNVGHSSSDAKGVLEAQSWGAKGITHLYNAMSQHLHRTPGVVTGAILSTLYCELIADGFHIHEDVIKATYKSIGKDRIILICDANPCKGLPDGIYPFSGKEVEIIDGKARVKETGRIAGSTLTLHEACKNMIDWCHCSINDVVQMACVNPATLYGLNKGRIEKGCIGDIVIVDKNMDIKTVVNQMKIINV